jgi:hypothetical protein
MAINYPRTVVSKGNQVNRQSAFYILTVQSIIVILTCRLSLPHGTFICLGDVNDSIESEGSNLLEKEKLKVSTTSCILES